MIYVTCQAPGEDFCIAVRGHAGWSKSPDNRARYALTVTIQSVGQQLAIYEPLEIANEELLTRIEIEQEAEAEMELDESTEEEYGGTRKVASSAAIARDTLRN